jgi:sulfur carrier protein ThiS
MTVKINLGPFLKHFAQNKEIIFIDGRTIQECLKNLLIKYPSMEKQFFDEQGRLSILVVHNSEIIPSDKFNTELNDQDQLSVLLVIGAG